MSVIIKKIYKNISNIPGWSTNRKIVVIDSDDWGSIRMPSRDVYQILKKKKLNFSEENIRYNLYDTLASKKDIEELFSILLSYKDVNGNNPVITAVSVVANPDFKKIQDEEFQNYYYEPFTDTLEKYYGSENPMYLWKYGINKKIFVPQFHGREHLNVKVWMRALRRNDEQTITAFNKGLWGFNNYHKKGIKYQAAFDLEKNKDIIYQKSVIVDGLNLFEKIFGYRATYFVPPNGPFNSKLERDAAVSGIKYLSTPKIHREPKGDGKTKIGYHYIGQQNQYKQIYLTRNCFFEPSQKGREWVDSALSDISIAFKWNKPAVISTHRVNYIGGHYPENREKGLRSLNELLRNIINKWCDVEFVTSDMLGEIIRENCPS